MNRRIEALRRERQAVLDFCRDLSAAEWDRESQAAGWRVRDVVLHLSVGCETLFNPRLLITSLRTDDIENLNDQALALRREWSPDRALGAYERWSRRTVTTLRLARGPVAALTLPLGNLGRYPVRVLPSVFVFDWHVHLRHDIAPALGRPAPPTDELRMAATLEWMLAGLEQMNRATMGWMDRPVTLALTGLAGGTWQIKPVGEGRLSVEPGAAADAATTITGQSVDFPLWATTRGKWRDQDLSITGDQEYAARFLDFVNII